MKRWQMIIGIALIIIGFFTLINVIFDIDLWRYIWPLALVGLGLLLILRPRIAGPDVQVRMPLLADVRMKGGWEIGQHEFWTFVGSLRFDLTEAEFSTGENRISIYGFVPDVTLILPENIGLKIEAAAFVSEIKTPDSKQERFLAPLVYETPNFSTAEHTLIMQVGAFVGEVKIKRPLI